MLKLRGCESALTKQGVDLRGYKHIVLLFSSRSRGHSRQVSRSETPLENRAECSVNTHESPSHVGMGVKTDLTRYKEHPKVSLTNG